MRCDGCRNAEAVFHLTRIEEGVSTTQHLCVGCAAQRGISAEIGLKDVDAIVPPSANDPMPKARPREETAALACSGCGVTLIDLQASWRVGCAECWRTFEQPLREAVRQFHGGIRHTGKQYGGEVSVAIDPAALERRERERLRQALAAAVALERFEDAAALRDQLRTLDE